MVEKLKRKSNKGITLIALVITIIVLLILAGISIATLTGENSVLTKAETSKTKIKEETAKEEIKLAWASVTADYNEGLKGNKKADYYTKENLNKEVKQTGEITEFNYNENGITTLVYIKNKKEEYHMEIEITGEVKIKNELEKPIEPEEKPSEIGKTDGSWTGKVNSPKLGEGMTAVYWDESMNEVEGDVGAKWYDYVAGDNSTDTKISRWANAKTSDGSYWVWIPRYEYKILSGEGTNSAGKIKVKFIQTNQTEADEGYKIHPAFRDGTSNKFKNGEWNCELAGFWMGKFKASRIDATHDDAGKTWSMKMVPNVKFSQGAKIGSQYTLALNYDVAKGSHLTKNSEWGAVAYLGHSDYGRNGYDIDINRSMHTGARFCYYRVRGG